MRRTYYRPPVIRGDYTKVYFIGEGNGPIKIGVSNDPPGRLRTILCGNHRDLQLLATIQGEFDVERELKARFRDAVIRREWYEPVPGLLALIEEIKAGEATR